MSSNTDKLSKDGATLFFSMCLLVILGAASHVYWLKVIGGAGLLYWLTNYSWRPAFQKRWDELLDAIRQRRQTGEPASSGDGSAADSSASKSKQEYERRQELDQGFEPQQEEERREPLIAIAHHKSPFKHIPGQSWSDPNCYVSVSTPKELEQARETFDEQEALKEREAEIREHDEALNKRGIEKRERDEAREQEARDFLVRESERVLKEREEREAAQKREIEAQANRTRWTH